MNEDRSTTGPGRRTWLERISQALLGEPRDRDEIIELLRNAEQREVLDADALAMIEGVLQVSEMQVRDIMVPRGLMVVVERDMPLDQMIPVITESAHSRFPVIGDSRDEILGILLAKDLLTYCFGREANRFNVRDILRPAVFIPESKRLNVLLREFRASRNHMAIVVDEYGGVSGLVTIEDVLEQIVGEIEDEHDFDEESLIRMFSQSRFTVKALTPIDEFNDYFGSNFSDEEYDTIAGLVIQGFGRLPKRGESVQVGDFRFKVLHADNRRIHLLEVVPQPQRPPADQPPAE